jgi:hypothetical protein
VINSANGRFPQIVSGYKCVESGYLVRAGLLGDGPSEIQARSEGLFASVVQAWYSRCVIVVGFWPKRTNVTTANHGCCSSVSWPRPLVTMVTSSGTFRNRRIRLAHLRVRGSASPASRMPYALAISGSTRWLFSDGSAVALRLSHRVFPLGETG